MLTDNIRRILIDFLFTFCLDTKSNKNPENSGKAVRKFLQNYGSVFSPKSKLIISEILIR